MRSRGHRRAYREQGPSRLPTGTVRTTPYKRLGYWRLRHGPSSGCLIEQ